MKCQEGLFLLWVPRKKQFFPLNKIYNDPPTGTENTLCSIPNLLILLYSPMKLMVLALQIINLTQPWYLYHHLCLMYHQVLVKSKYISKYILKISLKFSCYHYQDTTSHHDILPEPLQLLHTHHCIVTYAALWAILSSSNKTIYFHCKYHDSIPL